jgi:calcineurin-like phosphoesterase family protein
MNIWFTADHHFGHKRIIELANRPFSSVEEMDDVMIAKWNERVAPGDMVFHLGDFAFTDHTPYLRRLNGEKRLAIGNHDHSNRVKKAKGWSTVDSLLHVTVEDTRLVLCHYALRVWNRSHHGALHLYGHSHGSLIGDSQSCDVGVDCWSFNPVSLDEIRAVLALQETRWEPDHHQPKRRINDDPNADQGADASSGVVRAGS